MLVGVWQDSRFSGGVRDGVAFTRSVDGGDTWSAPVQINAVPGVQALMPAVTVRADGTIGVLYYDMRNDTADPATLLVDVWLTTSSDGVTWTERHVSGPFDLNHAPLTPGGLFVGDYSGTGEREWTVRRVFRADQRRSGEPDRRGCVGVPLGRAAGRRRQVKSAYRAGEAKASRMTPAWQQQWIEVLGRGCGCGGSGGCAGKMPLCGDRVHERGAPVGSGKESA